MATAKKLPSGNWRVQVYIGKDDFGKNIYKSITASSKDEAEYEAARIKLRRDQIKRNPTAITLQEAMEKYISKYEGILSPSTVRGYRTIVRNNIQSIMQRKLCTLTRDDVQKALIMDSKRLAPKTINNIYNLLIPTLEESHPELYQKLQEKPPKLPQVIQREQRALEPEEITVLFQAIRGDVMEIPILLAAWLCMRRSEILGLQWDCVDFDAHTIRIKRALVRGEKGTVIKSTKTASSTRTITMPRYIETLLKEAKEDAAGDFVVTLTPGGLESRWRTILKHAELPNVRFHDLRHSNASVMLALGIPYFYAQRRGGWASDNMLKKVYGHVLESKRNDFDDTIDSFFDSLLPHTEK